MPVTSRLWCHMIFVCLGYRNGWGHGARSKIALEWSLQKDLTPLNVTESTSKTTPCSSARSSNSVIICVGDFHSPKFWKLRDEGISARQTPNCKLGAHDSEISRKSKMYKNYRAYRFKGGLPRYFDLFWPTFKLKVNLTIVVYYKRKTPKRSGIINHKETKIVKEGEDTCKRRTWKF